VVEIAGSNPASLTLENEMDWNDWLAELNEILRQHQVESVVSLVAQYWSHVRYSYKIDETPEQAAEWLMERSDRYEVLEAYADEEGEPTSDGVVIATNLTEYEANRMIDRLYDEDKVWWKKRCYINQKESYDTA
jgi:hypothetical protein